MSSQVEYHTVVRHCIPVSVALAGTLLLPALFPTNSQAQVNGVPSSVTSPGFGGRAVNGTQSSVTSLGPRGYSAGPVFSGTDARAHHRHHYVEYPAPALYAFPVPYAVDIGQTEDDDRDPEAEEYQGGPTIFDRRGAGEKSYVPPVTEVPRPHARSSDPSAPNYEPPAPPEPPQDPTVLVFKDGHKVELQNYAIIGENLIDLTPGHSRRVALADLNLDATRQVNEDHGVVFQLPVLKAN